MTLLACKVQWAGGIVDQDEGVQVSCWVEHFEGKHLLWAAIWSQCRDLKSGYLSILMMVLYCGTASHTVYTMFKSRPYFLAPTLTDSVKTGFATILSK